MQKFSLFIVFLVFVSARGWVINNIDFDQLERSKVFDFDKSVDKDDVLVPEERINLIYPGKKIALQIILSLDTH